MAQWALFLGLAVALPFNVIPDLIPVAGAAKS